MKEYEIHVSASYVSGGSMYWNSFKEYVEANSESEAKEKLIKELKEDGYKNIKLDRPIEVKKNKGEIKTI